MLVYITCELSLLNCLENLFLIAIQLNQASLVAQTIKNLPALQDTWDWFLGRKDPLEREWLPAPVFLTGEFRGAWWAVVYGVSKSQTLLSTSQFLFHCTSQLHQHYFQFFSMPFLSNIHFYVLDISLVIGLQLHCI